MTTGRINQIALLHVSSGSAVDRSRDRCAPSRGPSVGFSDGRGRGVGAHLSGLDGRRRRSRLEPADSSVRMRRILRGDLSFARGSGDAALRALLCVQFEQSTPRRYPVRTDPGRDAFRRDSLDLHGDERGAESEATLGQRSTDASCLGRDSFRFARPLVRFAVTHLSHQLRAFETLAARRDERRDLGRFM